MTSWRNDRKGSRKKNDTAAKSLKTQEHGDWSIGNLRKGEWDAFLRLAKAEAWCVPERETKLFRGPLADSAFGIRSQDGTCGFVTAINHEHNGWIGNLIVAEAYRGQGHGSALLDHAIVTLRGRGARCIWLTASELGRPIYERRGFTLIDGIDRWTRKGAGKGEASAVSKVNADAVIAADTLAWGGSRSRLLMQLAADGEVYSGGASVMLLQVPGPMRVLGPWVIQTGVIQTGIKQTGHDDVADLLAAAVAMTPVDVEIVIDVRRGAKLDQRLEQAGFQWQGYNAFMAHGSVDHVDLSRIFSLATLGSMG